MVAEVAGVAEAEVTEAAISAITPRIGIALAPRVLWQEVIVLATGTVKWFNVNKGYGFIGRENGADLFIHQRAIDSKDQGPLAEGDIVEFNVTSGPKGESASNVRVVQKLKPSGGSALKLQSLDEKIKTLRKTSKEKQSDLSNRLKRR